MGVRAQDLTYDTHSSTRKSSIWDVELEYLGWTVKPHIGCIAIPEAMVVALQPLLDEWPESRTKATQEVSLGMALSFSEPAYAS